MLPYVLRVVMSLALLAILAACAAMVSPGSAPTLAPSTRAAPATAALLPSPIAATNTPPASPMPAATQGPSATPQKPGASATPGATTSPAVAAARLFLAQQLGVPESDVTLATSSAVEWPDLCLGVAGPGEMCAQMITPGYRIVLKTPQGSYELHTDLTGSQVRMVPPSGLVPVAPPAATAGPTLAAAPAELPAVQAARKTLAAQLKLAPEQLQLQSVEAVEWGSSCLGAAGPRENCLQVITPGYRIVFRSSQGAYEVHTNRDGTAVRVVGANP